MAEARPAHGRQPLEVIGRAYEPRSMAGMAEGGGLFGLLVAGLQLILPVTLLIVLAAAAYVYGDRPVLWLGPAQADWLTMGHLVVPLTFFAIQLTNRRYGAGYALTQTVLAWLIGGAALWFAAPDLTALAGRALPSGNAILGFGAGLFVAQLFSVLVFDRTRGPRWWTAPFLSTLWAGWLFCLIAFPLTWLGTPVDWFGRLVVYAGIMAAAAVLLLLPYWLLRRMVPPQSGFGGY